MPFSVDIFSSLDFVLTQCGKIIDDHTFRIHLLNFQAEINGMKTVRELADTRTIEKADNATLKGLVELAQFNRHPSYGREEYLAIVTNNRLIYKIARLYAKSISGRKKAIGFFPDVMPALHWLGYGRKDVNRLQGFIRRHRV